MSANRDRFASRLRRLRQERGFSAARHFAQTLGIPENRYTRYERGDSEPDLDDLYLFFEHLPASPNELFGVASGTPRLDDPPGFAAGPQERLLVPTDKSRTIGDPTRAVTPARRSEADAAAWALATSVIRHKRLTTSGRGLVEHLTLAELREGGLLYKALCRDPYETVAHLVTTSEIEPDGSDILAIEQAIELYLRCLD
jgi:transcriptional regulator with XRE-family HTH domain